MTNYQAGHDAEKEAARYLEEQGFNIRELNWKTKYCEIDIIAEKDHTIHFVEVKYRAKSGQGDGFAYITPQKLKQMEFAATMWLQQNDWDGDCILTAIAASPNGFETVDIT
jgi:uncharacterized protein (TIGR00252 family)